MARKALFDPTDRELFDDQRQRFDWSLLQNGTVFRYDTRFQVDSAGNRLADLGYLIHRIDGQSWTSIDDMYDALAAALGYRRSYGASLDAMSDVFADVGTYDFGSDPGTTGTVLTIAGFDTLAQIDGRTAHHILDIFAREARLAGLYGHPMLCLVESTIADLGVVGGFEVYGGSVWDIEPDPPDPFGFGDLIDFDLRVYVTDPTDYVAELRLVLDELFSPMGRWQLLPPVAIVDPTAIGVARGNAQHRPEPPAADSRLWQICVGLRGEGDHSDLGDRLVHGHSNRDLHFEHMSSRRYDAGSADLEEALSRYPELRASLD